MRFYQCLSNFYLANVSVHRPLTGDNLLVVNHRQPPRADLIELGERLRELRLQRSLPQATLADAANVSLSAIQSLEAGSGSSLVTLARVLGALGVDDWIDRLVPPVSTFNPLTLIGVPQRSRTTRRRAPRQQRSAGK
jgi:transcriptional regulator with XRE-family HTH domain